MLYIIFLLSIFVYVGIVLFTCSHDISIVIITTTIIIVIVAIIIIIISSLSSKSPSKL